MPLTFIKQGKLKAESRHDGVQLLLRHLRASTPERSHKTLHVSDLTSEDKIFCAREFALMDAARVVRMPKRVFPAMRVAFDIGNAYADLVRNKWLVDCVVGDWVCGVCGGTRVRFSKLPYRRCSECGYQSWRYEELVFTHPENGVRGSLDMLLDVNADRHVVYEIKSIDKDHFKSLKMPEAEHRIRTQCYLRLVHLSDFKSRINTDVARVLYISKGYGAKSEEHGTVLPFKEFLVEANHDAADLYFRDGSALADWRRPGGKMPGRICPNMLAPRSQKCAMFAHCWSEEFPPGARNDAY